MSWWKYAGGLSPGPAAIPNPANPVAWQRVYYERGQPIEVCCVSLRLPGCVSAGRR
jgi:hypothetical protein